MKTLTELYNDKSRMIVTAHRGASFEYPENTVFSMREAVKAGADIIEFDLRMTSDGIPVLLHDAKLDRTSNTSGVPADFTLAELKKFNFSYFRRNERLEKPFCEHLEIPSFEEILAEFRDQACMNIQVYAPPSGLETICALYRQYDMYDRGYLTIAKWEDAALVRSLDPKIEICMTPGWKERTEPENLKRCREFGCRFVQPVREHSTSETFHLCRELGLCSNVFFTDDTSVAGDLLRLGANGVMTNRAELFHTRPGLLAGL